MTTFVRLLEVDGDHKGATLAEAAAGWRSGFVPDGIFQVEPSSFQQVPGSPFAYWVSERVRWLFTELHPFEGEGRTVKQGLATADDFRFVRSWWEVDTPAVGVKWFPFAKGGAYSPFYADVHPVVNWEDRGREIRSFCDPRSGRTYSRPQNVDFYFRAGLTWPLRGYWLSVQPVPTGCVFSVAGKMAFAPETELAPLLGLLNSRPFRTWIRLLAGAVRPQHEAGLIGRAPLPSAGESPVKKQLASCAIRAWGLRLATNSSALSSRRLTLPALLQTDGHTLSARNDAWSTRLTEAEAELRSIQAEIDDTAFDLYGIDGEDRRQMEEGFDNLVSSDAANEEKRDEDEKVEEDEEKELEGADPIALTEALLEWTLGVALGRFDVRLATGERPPPPEPDPFDPLPACSPGMLQDAAGLPAIVAPSGYPLELPPNGILVDDPRARWDVIARMEAVLEFVGGEHAHGWIQEAEAIVGRDLRDWLRRFGFERHLKRYSRNPRKAPLCWHLAPKSRAYGIWLYSPVATRDAIYRILNDHVDPRLKNAERRLLELRQDDSANTGQQRRELTRQESLVQELLVFREQVARVAPLWAPCRDDGVVLNCAVLWRLFDHHRAWQNECKTKWGELTRGKYDWAGWAMHLWPERVVRTCASDRSIAIAHGLEEALWEKNDEGRWHPRHDGKEQVAKETAVRFSPAIQAALDTFIRAE